jgi:hypothetical protein
MRRYEGRNERAWEATVAEHLASNEHVHRGADRDAWISDREARVLPLNRPGFPGGDVVWILRRHRDVLQLLVAARLGRDGRDVADRSEEPAVVEPVDPFESGELPRLEAAPGARPSKSRGLRETRGGSGPSKTRLESRLSRLDSQMVSSGLSSGDRGGGGRTGRTPGRRMSPPRHGRARPPRSPRPRCDPLSDRPGETAHAPPRSSPPPQSKIAER